jgi:hypothetical protein
MGQQTDKPKQDNRIRLHADVNAALDSFIHSKELELAGEIEIRIDRNEVASSIIRDFLTEKGHYSTVSEGNH